MESNEKARFIACSPALSEIMINPDLNESELGHGYAVQYITITPETSISISDSQ